MKSDLTPMLAQYHYFKDKYPDCLLFFRLGDFYELFYEDAEIGSKELGLVLTSRPAGKGRERIPMCGVPYHSAESYIYRLVKKGYRVAICEQVEDPSKAKGVVKRDVVRVITPGTFFEKETGGLASIYFRGGKTWIGYLNLAVGEFFGSRVSKEEIVDILTKFNTVELLIPKGTGLPEEIRSLKLTIYELDEGFFEEGEKEIKDLFHIYSAKALGFEDEEILKPLGALLKYARYTQKGFMPIVDRPKPFVGEGFVRVDYRARRGLELLESSEGRKDQSLFGVIDRTLTGMGRRRLRFHILNPFRDPQKIREIQDAVEELSENKDLREEIRETLKGISDLERLVSRISGNMASPRDLIHLKNSLKRVAQLSGILKQARSTLLRKLSEDMEDTLHVADDIENTLVENPPLHVKEGGLIREGVDAFLDELRTIRDNAQVLVKKYEEKLKKETGINSLKVGYNKVMGYYIEVTKPNLKFVPEYFKRRQTLSNAERFTTDDLSRLEEKILSAQVRINEIEYEIFQKLRERVNDALPKVSKNARVVAFVDYVQSLSQIAYEKGWVRPEITDKKEIFILEGRHPVIEEFVKVYVPNDLLMNEESFVHIITGPNMAGKSSYIRQCALIVLLAHMGSFVPAKEARIGLVDSIFARVGSGDVLAMGVSTFMNEMLEVANILSNATERSLIVLDEVGRGTSTYDGIAISKAIVEYIATKIKARTLVATHFLELTDLEKNVKGVKNFHMAVTKEKGEVVFLYTVVEGSAEGSFGVEVAKMAGLPKEVVERAKEILLSMEEKEIKELEKTYRASEEKHSSEALKDILKILEEIDVANTTPLQALITLAQLKERLKDIKIT